MSIPAGRIVALSARVISGGGNDLETNGMVLTKSALLPTGNLAMIFSSADAVSELFGPEADETAFAQQYFTGVNNQQKAPESLVIGRRVAEAAAAWIRGGVLSADLAAFKAITDGSMVITVGGDEKTVSSLDLSSATSLSDVATKVAEAITGVTGSYDSNSNTFTFTTEATGAEATIGYASDAVSAAVGMAVVGEAKVSPLAEGTPIADMLGLTQASAAVLSQGADQMTEADNLNAICEVTRNWVGFTTLWETELAEAEALAAWADSTGDDYVYFDWTLDENVTSQLTQSDTKPALLEEQYNCTACIYGDWRDAAFALAVGASIAWTRTQGMKVWFAKTASGISPRVTSESVADALEAVRCNYTGEFATRNDRFDFFNQGTLTSDQYGYIDVLYGSIYLKNAIQVSCMEGFQRTNRTPYNARGTALIRAWVQDPINRCINNGVIDAGITLNESQRAQIMQEVGDDLADTACNDIQSKGYFVNISLPDAAGRATREAPYVTVYYAYAGSVQSLQCEVVSVI